MERTSLALAMMLFMGLTVAHVGQAQNSPKDYLDLHNAVRSEVGVGPFKWDATLASYAQKYAIQRAGDCQLIHSQGPYGENIYMGIGEGYADASAAVKWWADEKQYYDYSSNECAPGQECRHYTQIVWRGSERLGCASAQCTNGYTFTSCNYDPPGNFIGQKPY